MPGADPGIPALFIAFGQGWSVGLGVALGFALFGLGGALLAIPAAALLKLLYQEYYIDSEWYRRGEAGAPEIVAVGTSEPD